MKSQRNNQKNPARQRPQAQGGATQAVDKPSGDAGSSRDPQELAQAVRSVMHPESHEPEWRYVYGAMHD